MRVWLRNALWEKVPRDHRETPAALRRRQLVTLGFVVLGGAVLGLSLRIEPGNPLFYPATVGLAAVWTIGAFASGPIHLGRITSRSELRRPVVAPIAIGLALAAIFVGGALVVREVPWLGSQVVHVLDFADQGSLPLLALITLVNGIAEELFFRGAAYAATTRLPGHRHHRGVHPRHARHRQRDAVVRGGAAGHGGGPAAPRLRRHPGADPDALHLVVDDALRAAAGVRLATVARGYASLNARRTDSS